MGEKARKKKSSKRERKAQTHHEITRDGGRGRHEVAGDRGRREEEVVALVAVGGPHGRRVQDGGDGLALRQVPRQRLERMHQIRLGRLRVPVTNKYTYTHSVVLGL